MRRITGQIIRLFARMPRCSSSPTFLFSYQANKCSFRDSIPPAPRPFYTLFASLNVFCAVRKRRTCVAAKRFKDFHPFSSLFEIMNVRCTARTERTSQEEGGFGMYVWAIFKNIFRCSAKRLSTSIGFADCCTAAKKKKMLHSEINFVFLCDFFHAREKMKTR